MNADFGLSFQQSEFRNPNSEIIANGVILDIMSFPRKREFIRNVDILCRGVSQYAPTWFARIRCQLNQQKFSREGEAVGRGRVTSKIINIDIFYCVIIMISN